MGTCNIILSGGFDPPHSGHIQMLNDARRFGNLYVLLNSEEWIVRKKGYSLMGMDNRISLLHAMKVNVLPCNELDDADGTVIGALNRYVKYLVDECNIERSSIAFGNGGDRVITNTPEAEWCLRNGIKLIFGLGGGKSCSSSNLVENAFRRLHDRTR